MRKIRIGGVLIIMLLLGWGGTKLACARPIANKIVLSGVLQSNTYTMGDLKHDLEANNQFIRSMGGEEIKFVTSSLSTGFGILYGAQDNVLMGLELSYLPASYGIDKEQILHNSQGWWYFVSYKTNMPAWEIGPLVKVLIPLDDQWSLTVGAGVNLLLVSGKQTIQSGTHEIINDLNGTGLGWKVSLGGEYTISELLSLGVDLGFRNAVIQKITNQTGDTYVNADLSDFSLDYGGFFAAAGVKLYL